jgi:hypothetical protein
VFALQKARPGTWRALSNDTVSYSIETASKRRTEASLRFRPTRWTSVCRGGVAYAASIAPRLSGVSVTGLIGPTQCFLSVLLAGVRGGAGAPVRFEGEDGGYRRLGLLVSLTTFVGVALLFSGSAIETLVGPPAQQGTPFELGLGRFVPYLLVAACLEPRRVAGPGCTDPGLGHTAHTGPGRCSSSAVPPSTSSWHSGDTLAAGDPSTRLGAGGIRALSSGSTPTARELGEHTAARSNSFRRRLSNAQRASIRPTTTVSINPEKGLNSEEHGCPTCSSAVPSPRKDRRTPLPVPRR